MTTSPEDGSGSGSFRISPWPGLTIQNARASRMGLIFCGGTAAGYNPQSLPVMSLRTRALIAGSAGIVLVWGAATAIGGWLALTPEFPWRAALVFAAVAAIVAYGVGG